ncbi:vWA domain-containing protein [Lutibacter maritimus]|uniref:VWFA domain-containing protein n=1 Tax=Lutibacter maritimus TaxID=593133 RepID=A0A1I6P2S9_9FLAO|nr:vWA domain-containing protein [Lutibacter maritimus]SFS34509.1 hypothetical protein SAMN04488006_0840 [Lutibacter maritimus]
MKKIRTLVFIVTALLIVSCNNDISTSDDYLMTDDFSSSSGEYPEGGQQEQAGLITAGEWNDLANWDFWNNLLNGQSYSDKSAYWSFYTNNRVSVQVKQNSNPAVNVTVAIKKNQDVIWETKTDNFGIAELWIGLFDKETTIDVADYSLFINNQQVDTPVKCFEDGIISIELNSIQNTSNKVELSFIVDATGSMGDELEFLKDDLKSVIQRVKNENSTLDIFTSTVFYRDEGDAYVVKHSNFTNDISSTLNFINQQSADGGGDFPEAVDTALNAAVNNLQWSDNSKTRIAFLLLDAPPHYTNQIINTLQNLIKKASQKGIKLIPVTASGIDKETEFLMRFFSVSTNGTYVFITNHSGIGNDHLEASVGAYDVETLNDLLVRLINKYAQ